MTPIDPYQFGAGAIAFLHSSYPVVYKLCRLIAGNSEYRLIGLHLEPTLSSFSQKLACGARYWLTGENAVLHERRLAWCSVAGFEMFPDSQCKHRIVRNH